MKNSKLNNTNLFLQRYASLLIDIHRTLSKKPLPHCNGFSSAGETLFSHDYLDYKTNSFKKEDEHEK